MTTQRRHQNFDYTTIADWLRKVSWSNDSHPTGVVKPVYRIPTFPLTAEAVLKSSKTEMLMFSHATNQTTLTFKLGYMIPVNLLHTNRQFHAPSRFKFNKILLREWRSYMYVRRKNKKWHPFVYWSNIWLSLWHMYNTLIVEQWWIWTRSQFYWIICNW